jgi:hypothetical protein
LFPYLVWEGRAGWLGLFLVDRGRARKRLASAVLPRQVPFCEGTEISLGFSMRDNQTE